MRLKKKPTRKSGRNLTKLLTNCSKSHLLKLLLLFVIFSISINCTGYNPAFYPSYDVLNPGPEVRKNPLAVITISASLISEGLFEYDGEIVTDQQLQDGKAYLIVDEYFMAHYYELWNEVEKLRKD